MLFKVKWSSRTSTVRVSFHAPSAKYFVITARVISCWKTVFEGQRVTEVGKHNKPKVKPNNIIIK